MKTSAKHIGLAVCP